MGWIFKYSIKTLFKFFFFSGFGIFAFFINFNIPEFLIKIPGYEVLILERNTFLVDHAAKIVQSFLMPIMPYIVLVFALLGIVDLYFRKEKHFKTLIQKIFSLFKICGFIILVMIVFNIGPEIFSDPGVGPFVLNKILVSISISIPMAALFLPLLLDYGLVDFIGVLMRPLMRPLFKLPGRAAVIAVSAFLGNFSIGHIAVNNQYCQGKMTGRESAVIGTSLSTVSIGFLMVLAGNAGIMDYWNQYFWSTFLITLLVTLIGIRLYPLRNKPDNYHEGVTPDPEPIFKKDLFKNALIIALNTADAAPPLHVRIKSIMKETLLILGTVASGTAFFGPIGVILMNYTPLFQWVGIIFYPFMYLAGIPGNELTVASTSAAVSFLEVTLPVLSVATGEWSLRLRYMLAVIPVSSIIFLASFVPCLMATEIPVKFSEMVIIWIERMILSILITGIFGMILF